MLRTYRRRRRVAAALRRDEIAPTATSFKTAAAIGEAQIEIGLFQNHDEVAQVVGDAGGREREEDNLGWMDGWMDEGRAGGRAALLLLRTDGRTAPHSFHPACSAVLRCLPQEK